MYLFQEFGNMFWHILCVNSILLILIWSLPVKDQFSRNSSDIVDSRNFKKAKASYERIRASFMHIFEVEPNCSFYLLLEKVLQGGRPAYRAHTSSLVIKNGHNDKMFAKWSVSLIKINGFLRYMLWVVEFLKFLAILELISLKKFRITNNRIQKSFALSFLRHSATPISKSKRFAWDVMPRQVIFPVNFWRSVICEGLPTDDKS